MSLIQISDIQKVFTLDHVLVKAIKTMTLNIDKGEFVSIIGPSGSGKTTLLHILGCLSRPTSGSYLFDGIDVTHMNDQQLAGIRSKRIGFIFQSFNLLPSVSAVSNVSLPLIYNDTDIPKRQQKAKEMLSSLGLSHRLKHYPNQLSGGEQQRVAIARALVCNPDIILADEPTGNLDTTNGMQIMEILSNLHKQGKTVIIVTHNEKIAKMTNRMICVEDGKIFNQQ